MKKFIRNICALSLSGIMLMSGCSSVPESNFKYPEGYEVKAPVTETVIKENTSDFTGNTGNVTIEEGDTYAIISVKDFGAIKIKLFPEAAPYGVQNFIDLALSGYFDGKSIHRVMSDFMIQGGSLNGDGTGGNDSNGGSFRNEINTEMRHYYGALCYARAMGSNSCQFYIVNNKTAINDTALQYEAYIDYYKSMVEQYKSMQSEYDATSQEYAIIDMYIGYYNESISGLEAMLKTADGDVDAKYQSGGVPFLDGCYTVFGQTVEGFDVIDKISAVEVTTSANGEASQPAKEILIDKVVIMTA